jgi:CubicO group peptidase (beta-lactamase class C family)
MTMTSEGLRRVYDAMAARVDRGELPGLVTLIAQGDEVRIDAIGTTGFDTAEPMRRDTPFRIASLTKPIAATVTMMLAEDGVIALDEPVDRLLPELADRRVLSRVDGPLDETVPAERPIRIEDLLTFRLGFGMLLEPTFDPPFPIVQAANEAQLALGPPEPRTPHNPDEWIRRFGALPLMYQPGQRWQYNTGTLLLGVLLARAAGQDLGELFRTRLFEPLGMLSTGFHRPESEAARLPRCYLTNFETGKLEEQTVSPPELWTSPPAFPSASAGLVSTVDDYLAFARLLANGGVHNGRQLLSAKSVIATTTNRLTDEDVTFGGPILGGRGWGYGMSVTRGPEAGRYGWEGGSGTVWSNDPRTGRICLALTQTSDFIFNGGSIEFLRTGFVA